MEKLEQFWIWLKANWWIPFASVLILVSYFAGNRGKANIKDMMRAQKEDYEAQIKALHEQRAKEKKIMEDYKKSLEILNQKYKVKEKEIKRVNRAKLKKTIEQNEEKPIEEIADDFAKRFNLERI